MLRQSVRPPRRQTVSPADQSVCGGNRSGWSLRRGDFPAAPSPRVRTREVTRINRRKFLAAGVALMACLSLASSARALDLPISGGRSPNGRYEVRVSGKDEESLGYCFTLFDRKRGRTIWESAEVLGQFCDLRGASAIDKARWNSAGSSVAVTDHSSRHSMELYVFTIMSGKLRPVKTPDAVPFAMEDEADGRPGSIAGDVWEPLRWNGDTLIARVIAQLNYRWCACEATLKLEHYRYGPPRMRLVRVTKAKEWAE